MHRVSTSRAYSLPLLLTMSAGCIAVSEPDDGDPQAEAEGTDEPGNMSGQGAEGSDPDPNAGPIGALPSERAVDIIFVVDNSGSMGEEQSKLARSIDVLVDSLNSAVPPVDYRIAVTNTDNGNPWCLGTDTAAGEFRATSCRTRTDDFVFNGAVQIDSTEEACLSVCGEDELDLTVPWVDVQGSTGATNVPSGDVTEALHCMLPQGINGCGFEQPLESLSKALERAETLGESNNGFLRPGALLAVAVITDEVDCSTNPLHDTIFLPEGNRVFWSDSHFPAPTSAVCWNAGVQCDGSGTYDDCYAVDLNVDGDPAGGNPDQTAVLRPIDRYIDDLVDRGAYVVAINGVGSDGEPVYTDSSDPAFQNDFGIGVGCTSPSGQALPPVRLRQVVEEVTGPGNLHSVCDDDFSLAFATMGEGILSRLP